MEVLRNEDLGAGFLQPGQPGWFPPSLSTLPPLPSSGSAGSGVPRELPPSLTGLLQPSSCDEPGDPRLSSFEERCVGNLAKACAFAEPPSSVYAGAMEVLRNEDLRAGFPQPGQPGWFPPSLSTLPPVPSSGSSRSGVSRELPPSLTALLKPSSCDKPGDPRLSSFEERCAANLAKAYAFAEPPSSVSAGERTDTKKRHVLRASPKVILEQSKKYARGALEHYNKRKKIKFELMDVMPINNMAEGCNHYMHVNFTAKCTKEGSEEQLFFAELQLCSRRQASSGFVVTYCEPLGPHYTVGHRGVLPDDSVVRKNVDFTHCFACSARMLHPKGEKYIAGHCNIPYFYSSPY